MSCLVVPSPEVPRTCCACCVPLQSVSVVTADLDQAFEACSTKLVVPAWLRVSAIYASITGRSSVLIRKGKRDFAEVPRGGYGRGWWSLSISLLTRAIFAYAFVTFVVLGDLVFILDGLAIGGLLSMGALAVVLADKEQMFSTNGPDFPAYEFRLPPRPIWQSIGLCRYVDDLIACSYVLCGDCLLRVLMVLYGLRLKPCAGTSETQDAIATWVDLEVHPNGDGLVLTYKNENRAWLQDPAGPRPREVLLPWAGAFPRGLGMACAQLWSKVCRIDQLSLGVEAGACRIMEDVAEMFLIGYHDRQLRRLLYRLPWHPAVVLARDSYRAWRRSQRAMSLRQGKHGARFSGHPRGRPEPQRGRLVAPSLCSPLAAMTTLR